MGGRKETRKERRRKKEKGETSEWKGLIGDG